MARTQILNGVVLPDGELHFDGVVDLVPGRVRVVVTECPIDAQEDDPWSRLERTWSEQRARHLQRLEAEAAQPSELPSEPAASSAKSLSPAAIDLRLAMSAISEDCYCAGWLISLEYQLWSAVMNGPVAAGCWNVTQSDIDRLRLLARRCGGWIVWDETQLNEAWLPIENWLRQYDEYLATHAASTK